MATYSLALVFTQHKNTWLAANTSHSGLPDDAKFGKYCQKSLFSKKFANFFGNIF